VSKQKSKQIKALAQIPMSERYDALQFQTPLHREAFGFNMTVHNGLWLKVNPHTVPSKHKKWIKYHYDNAIEAFTRRYFDAYIRKDGNFFRALADVLEGENPNWSNRERFIFAKCDCAINMGGSLPSAGQILRSWKTRCGMIPDRADDLALLWQSLFGNRPMPKVRAAVERILRPFLGEPNPTAANVQIVQIQREAKNMGFNLPKQSGRNCLPAGYLVVP
jgi:hypothetical protein